MLSVHEQQAARKLASWLFQHVYWSVKARSSTATDASKHLSDDWL